MRIAYLAHVNEGRGSGVVAKISAQLGWWRHKGHQVTLYLVTEDRDISWASSLGHVVVARYHTGPSRIRAMARVVRSVRTSAPDVIYVRWELFYPPMLWFPSGTPLAAEVNTNDVEEYALGSWMRATYNRLTRGFLLGRADAIVFANGPELSNLPAFSRFRGRKAVITNGIDLSAYPSLPADAEGPPRLAFVGTGDAPWHGIDKLVNLASLRPEWRFDIVGKHAVAGMDRPNIVWHGPLERPAVLDVLRRADVGVGALALHRNQMNEACTLKMREYLAVGLPVVYGCPDPDADGLGRYVLRIANTETSVVDGIDQIDAFVTSARGVRIPRAAVAHIDVAHKEEQRLALFADLASD